MNEQDREDVFRAQTTNVQELERAWKLLNRQLNAQMVANNSSATLIDTKLLALLYSALAEATFSKIIHTPHGLSLAYISQIKAAVNSSGVKAGWTKCIELALHNVAASKSNHGPNIHLRLERLVHAYIFDPSLIRNKLAHGQWKIALNRANDAVNSDLTAQMAALDVIRLYRLKEALTSLAGLVEDIIESPNKAHMRDFWPRIYAMQDKQYEMSQWTLQEKLAQLRRKGEGAKFVAAKMAADIGG